MEKKEKDNEYVDFVVTARKYKTTLTAKYKNRKMWHKPFVGDVISHLPGYKSQKKQINRILSIFIIRIKKMPDDYVRHLSCSF